MKNVEQCLASTSTMWWLKNVQWTVEVEYEDSWCDTKRKIKIRISVSQAKVIKKIRLFYESFFIISNKVWAFYRFQSFLGIGNSLLAYQKIKSQGNEILYPLLWHHKQFFTFLSLSITRACDCDVHAHQMIEDWTALFLFP